MCTKMCKKLICLVSFVLVLGLVNSASADLVGHWRFDEGSGTIANDSSGNGNNGTLVAGPTWVNGRFGGALEFDGADDRVDLGGFDLTTDTITYVALVNGSMTGGWTAIIFGRHVDRQITGIRLNSQSRLSYCWNYASTAAYNWGGGPQVPADEWALVAVTIEPERATAYVITQAQGLQSASNEIPHVSQQTTNLLVGWDTSMQYGFQGIIDEVQIHDRALTPDELQNLFDRGSMVLVGTHVPSPVNAETDVLRNVVLSWTPGMYADKHDVYFGTSFGDVNDASLTEDPGGVYLGRQDPNTLALDRLDLGQTYYWRVDEVNAAPDYTVYEGSVWQFTVEPVAYPVENITATASSSLLVDTGPENTVNGSGLDADDLHSIEQTDMWTSGNELKGACWIEFEFDKVYKLHEMLVWNSNQTAEPFVGYGCKDVTIEYSVDGNDYTTLGATHEFVQAPGTPGYAHNTTIDFDGVTAKNVKLTANNNWGGILSQYSLSEVRFLYIPLRAREPQPESGATDVDVDVTLGFRAGREADKHDVYLSSDEQAMIDGNAPVTTVTETSYGPLSLDLCETYYWKINEVNDAETPTMLEGDIWNFTTPEFFVVDDFEDYNDYPPDEIFSAWIDGWGDSANGALAAHDLAPWAETTIVHGGSQAIPFFYSNTVGATYSEATRTFAVPQDWTAAGVQTLALYFHGTAGNTGQLYVKINGSKVPYDGEASNLARTVWQPWNIELASFGMDLQSVTTLAIGVDGSGASGTLYFDDIRLYSYSREFITPAEPNNAGLVGHWKFDDDTLDYSGLGNNGTINGAPLWIEGPFGKALQLNGTRDYVDCGNAESLNITDKLTLSAWVKTVDAGEPAEGEMGGQNHYVSKDNSYQMKHRTNLLIFAIWDGGAQATRLSIDNSFNGEWHYVVGTYDGSVLKQYVDGKLEGEASHEGSIDRNEWNVNIGKCPANNTQYLNGGIDEVRIYDRALTQEEVAWLAGITKPFDKPF